MYYCAFVYVPTTREKKGLLCSFSLPKTISGLSPVKVGNSSYIAAFIQYVSSSWSSRFGRSCPPSYIELWNYPHLGPEPAYTAEVGFESSAHGFLDGKFFLHNTEDAPFVRTGPTVPTGINCQDGNVLSFAQLTQKLCVCPGGKEGKKRVILLHQDLPRDNTSFEPLKIRCIDHRGQLLWNVENHHHDGRVIHPVDICVYRAGQVFVADGDRVVLITCDEHFSDILGIQTFFTTEKSVRLIEWCDSTKQLILVLENVPGIPDQRATVVHYDVTVC